MRSAHLVPCQEGVRRDAPVRLSGRPGSSSGFTVTFTGERFLVARGELALLGQHVDDASSSELAVYSGTVAASTLMAHVVSVFLAEKRSRSIRMSITVHAHLRSFIAFRDTVVLINHYSIYYISSYKKGNEAKVHRVEEPLIRELQLGNRRQGHE